MPGSIPIVVPDGQQTQTTTKVVEQVVNQTVLQLPLQVQVQDANAVNKTALRLQVAGTLGVPLHAVLLDFGASQRRLDRLLTSHSRRLVALDLVVTISDEPAVNISYVEALWSSKSASTLSVELGVDIIEAPSPILTTKVIVRSATVTTLELVECPPGEWGANGNCIPCSRGTYKPRGTNGTGCLECTAGKYQPFLGGSECAVCGAGNYSANTLSCEPCQVGEFCAAGTSVGVRCPLAHSTTNGRGAKSEDDCVCQVGYYMDDDGCVPCQAVGTNCTAVGVTVATLPLLAGWWRLSNSTQLERCFEISNCTGGGDAHQLCGEGYEVELPPHAPLYSQ